jgi:hypothetical protein
MTTGFSVVKESHNFAMNFAAMLRSVSYTT